MIRSIVVGVLSATALLLGLSIAPAQATPSTLFVGTSAGSNTSCTDPGYTSVQAAVDAAVTSDTVYLCSSGSPYSEQVVVNKSITLTGDPGATIQAPNPWVASTDAIPPQFASDNLFVPQAILFVWGPSVSVNVTGVNVTGPLPGNGGCAEQEFGILVIDGAAANLSGDNVTNIQDSNSALFGCQFGIGVQVGRRGWPTSDFSSTVIENFADSATITGLSVSGYQKGGIVTDGPGSSAAISGNTVSGDGPSGSFGTIIAQNGIQLSRGAAGQVTGNTVSDNQYSGSGGASSSGILIFGGCGAPLTRNVSIKGNTLDSDDVGIFLFNANADCNAAPSTKTNNSTVKNALHNPDLSNTSGFGPACGYQAGISDLGFHDTINHNHISGVGYTPAQGSPTAGCTETSETTVVVPIDTTGAVKANAHRNL
jgi:hypothetical protein